MTKMDAARTYQLTWLHHLLAVFKPFDGDDSLIFDIVSAAAAHGCGSHMIFRCSVRCPLDVCTKLFKMAVLRCKWRPGFAWGIVSNGGPNDKDRATTRYVGEHAMKSENRLEI